MIKVALVDDHTITRTGLKTLIGLNDQISVMLEAGNGIELFQRLEYLDSKPDILILDISMPQMNGFTVVEEMQKRYPSIKIIILSMVTEEDTVVHMINRGACGFISKSEDPELLVNAILTVSKSGFYFGGIVKKDFIHNKNTRAKKGSFIGNYTISPKELNFIRLSASNLSYQEIAVRIGVSPKTIENYRDSIFQKLKINNRAALVLYGFKTGIVDNFVD